MRRAVNSALAVLLVTLAASLTGCGTMHIAMNPSSAFEMKYDRIPGKIVLVLDNEFRSYHWQTFSGAELRGLDYDLGTASKNIFLDAFRRASDNVTVTETRPSFPIADQGSIILVVHPRIAEFGEEHNALKRNADYFATITYHLIVYDKIGNIVLEKNYTETGDAMGYMDVNRNYAAPAEKAMAQAINKIIFDLSKLAAPQNPKNKIR